MGGLRIGVAAAALLVAVAPVARATSLASLKLEPASGPAGASVRVTGTWFAAPEDDRFSSVGPAQLRWGATDGPVLAVVEPDEGGTFITTITVPTAAVAGHHVVVAVQTVVDGDGARGPAPGTPARTVFTIGSRAGGVPTAAIAAHDQGSAWALLTALAAATGVAMFAGACGLLVRDLGRARSVPEPVRAAAGKGRRSGANRSKIATGGGQR
ncbi:MAG TPA: hypothetical protein VG452_10575 [Egibacteraceae bacterium]|nr:hypothetical protein [Egibacteraceae bacterium]